MRDKFKEVLELTRNGQPAQMKFEIEGMEYVRIFKPKERLIILGGGHVGKSVCTMASMVDFDITVVDDRPEYANTARFPEARQVVCDDFEQAIKNLKITNADYVVIVTRAHQYDAECIHAVLDEVAPYYIGLLGSKTRTGKLIEKLENEGTPAERLSLIHTPIGLTIGALTVEEIAVSIVAELVSYRRRNVERKSGDRFFTEETFHENIVEDLVENKRAQMLLLVYETKGSTPVKSGCFMTLDADGRCVGTIGGGKGENIAILEAKKLLGTGQMQTVTINMTEDITLEEGMVCGGIMKICLMDL